MPLVEGDSFSVVLVVDFSSIECEYDSDARARARKEGALARESLQLLRRTSSYIQPNSLHSASEPEWELRGTRLTDGLATWRGIQRNDPCLIGKWGVIVRILV